MNIHRLRLFVAVTDHGGFSRAAEAFYISQPAVSAQIQRLEQELEVSLFQKVGREVRLTEAGEALYYYAVRILALCDDAVETIAQLRETKRRRIRIAATTTPGVYVLPRLIEQLTAHNPELRIEIDIGNREYVLARIESFQSDLGLVAGAVEDEGFRVTPIMEDELLPVGAKGSSLAQMERVTLEEFAVQRLFLREAGSATRDRIDQVFRARGLTAFNVTELPNTEAIKQALLSGHGYAVVPRLAVKPEIEKGLLSVINVFEFHLRRSISLVVSKESQSSTIVRTNLDAVRAAIASLALEGALDIKSEEVGPQ